ncbi:hypothetical protein [Pelagerythrobacter sp.]|uniref:hypothetical protein n=1 Tax=Pelagerythrobacter sp. TaxID=2800702 RepID=UPI0035B036AC
MRPDSIRKFDMFWLGALALGVVNFLLTYGSLKAQIDAQFAQSGLDADMGGAGLIGGFVFGIVINLALWFLVSRLRLEFVKWILILLILLGLTGLPDLFATGVAVSIVLSLVAIVMQAAAIWFLFRPDAKAWFASKGKDPGAPTDPQ